MYLFISILICSQGEFYRIISELIKKKSIFIFKMLLKIQLHFFLKSNM